MLKSSVGEPGMPNPENLGLLDVEKYSEEEEVKQPLHTRILRGMVTGVGFLSDAYDLFIINGVLLIIAEYDPTVEKYKSGIATSVLVGAVLGQLGFGIVADKIGRRIGFIITLALVITGSIASSLSFSLGPMNVFQCLMLWRFVLGIGVGGEYPLSATISAETSSTHKRGKNTAMVFSMQGVGSLMATLAGFLFYLAMPHHLEYVWRVALAFGAVPGIIMIYFRVKMEETSRFAASKQTHESAANLPPTISRSYLTSSDGTLDHEHGAVSYSESGTAQHLWARFRALAEGEKVRLVRQNWRRLVGTAGSWFLLDITFYANGLFSTTILKVAGVKDDLGSVLAWNIYLALAALPGYWAAVFLIERMGRKPLQLFGFVLLGLTYLAMALSLKQLEEYPAIFFIMYALTFFVTNMGPNTTTYVLPSESFPTEIRATCHGISAAFGKLGAVVGSGAMTPLLHYGGLSTVLFTCSAVALVGAVHTFFFTVETLGKSLEQINTNKPPPSR